MIKFTCTACGHCEETEKRRSSCPVCLRGGWNLIHSYPVVESSISIRMPQGRSVIFLGGPKSP